MTSEPARPAPVVTDDNEFFWEAAREGRLVAQRCKACGRLRHPPRPMCPDCLDVEPEVVELSGRGSLYSYSILHHPQNPQFDYPVIAVLVELEEGLRMVSNLVADTVPDPLIGMPLRVAFAPTQHGFAVPVFERDGSRA